MNLSKTDKKEVSQMIEIQKACAYDPKKEIYTDWKHTVAMIFTIIAMCVGAALWASDAHADLKDWTAEQDFVTKKELIEVIKEQYVPRYEFVVVKEKLENTEEKLDHLQLTLDKLCDKMDIIKEGQNRGRRTNTNFNSD